MKKNSNTNSTTLTSNYDEPFGTKILRLHSGEDLVCGIMVDQNGNYIVDNPLHLMFKRTSVGTVMILLPWLPMEVIEENVAIINPKDVLTILDPKTKLIDYYNNSLEALKSKLEELENTPIEIQPEEEQEEDVSEALQEPDKSQRTLH